MPTWPLPDWVTLTSSALFSSAVFLPSVLSRLLLRDGDSVRELLRHASHDDTEQQTRHNLVTTALLLMEQTAQRKDAFDRLSRRVFTPLAAVSGAVLVAQLLSTLVTGEG